MTQATKSQLLRVLAALKESPLQVEDSAGGSCVVLPHGGRVLGLFPPNDSRNFLWNNLSLNSVASAADLLNSQDWQNTGGDRTWLAPELDFFYPEYPDLGTYTQPPQLDPGGYEVLSATEPVVLCNEPVLKSARTETQLELRITKRVSATPNPLEGDPVANRLCFAGYELQTTLEILNEAAPPCYVGLWNLLQMPHGGTLLIPTSDRTEPTVFFGDIPGEHLCVEDRLIRYKMSADGEQKLSVPAAAVTGRAAYVTGEGGGESSLVVRSFDVDRTGRYVDVCHSRPSDDGYAVQACNVRSRWGEFSELEYHAPAIGGATAVRRSDDVSRVWAFRGPDTAIRAAASKLLQTTTA